MTTLLSRRTQVHQNMLIGNLNPYSDRFRQALHATTQTFMAAGSSPSTASAQAYARLYGSVQRQSSMLAYVDCFSILAIVFVSLVPFVFIMKRVGPQKGAPPPH